MWYNSNSGHVAINPFLDLMFQAIYQKHSNALHCLIGGMV